MSKFDLKKEPKYKFDLRKDSDEETPASPKATQPAPKPEPKPSPAPTPQPSDDNQGGGGRKWVVLLLTAIALGGIIFGVKNCGTSQEPQPMDEPVEQTSDTTAVAPDSTTARPDSTTTEMQPSVGEESPEKVGITEQAPEQPTTRRDNPAAEQAATQGSVEQMAADVWKGVYGNGDERRRKLGASYDEVQRVVNEMHRTGRVAR